MLQRGVFGLCGLDGHVIIVPLDDLLSIVSSPRLNKSKAAEGNNI